MLHVLVHTIPGLDRSCIYDDVECCYILQWHEDCSYKVYYREIYYSLHDLVKDIKSGKTDWALEYNSLLWQLKEGFRRYSYEKIEKRIEMIF